MKDIKHIRRDFHLAAWVMPQGWDLGVPWGVLGGQIFLSPNLTRFGVWPWGGAKRSNIIKSEQQSQIQSFLNQTLCIF